MAAFALSSNFHERSMTGITVRMLQKSVFTPACWLHGSHLQTMAPLWLRRGLHISTIEEHLVFPDSDFTELSWTAIPKSDTSTPIVIVLHGLAGSKDSAYIKGMLKVIQHQGWTGVLMHFRGCGQRPNNRAAAYHSGETGDIRFFIQTLKKRFPYAPLAVVGFSLGGNVLVKYLGEEGSRSSLTAGVAVSAPLDLADCSRRINRGLSRLYQQYLLLPLKRGVQEKIQRFPYDMPLKLRALKKIRTLWQFDDQITAPLFGFSSAEHYYRKSSGKQFLKQIKTSCLLIHAQDDPFMTHACIPHENELSEAVTVELSAAGGHLGFVAGNSLTKPVFWCEQRISTFLMQRFHQ